jgi:hypothetical protein
MYITILFIIIAIVSIIAIARHGELSKALKGFVITMFIISISLAILFEWANSKAQKNATPTVLDFKHGKDLICRDKTINQAIYTYESGTSSFIPKNGVVGATYSVNECQVSK